MLDRTPKLRLLRTFFVSALLAGTAATPSVEAASLTPTRTALLRQVHGAEAHGYSYLSNGAQVRDFVRKGYLVEVPGNADYTVKPTVRYHVARPAVKLFLERLGAQYRDACGEQLVVTSLTRPRSDQPRNASPLSVHPTGMAMDLRIPGGRCRSWLERALLNLERAGVLEAARERRPPHYHVVLFPDEYASYLSDDRGVDVPPGITPALDESYRVRPGDNLWVIARRFGISVATLKSANDLRGTLLKPGQVLSIPAR